MYAAEGCKEHAGFHDSAFGVNEVPLLAHEARTTIVPILIRRKREIVVVQSAKDPHRRTWGLPQGGMHDHETPCGALIRECQEELRIPPADIALSKARVLGEFVNKLPVGREVPAKHLIFVGVHVAPQCRISLTEKENLEYQYVDSWDAYFELMAATMKVRWKKIMASCAAINKASAQGLLMWPQHDLSTFAQVA